jgi:hypothetical protein
MAFSLREQVESDLAVSLEGDWGLPVVLVEPDGTTISTSLNSGGILMGQVLYDTVGVNPDTGDAMVISNPIVTLRRTSLSRVPISGEKWLVKIPANPSLTAPVEDYVIDPSRAIEGGRTFGFVRLYLRRAKQA